MIKPSMCAGVMLYPVGIVKRQLSYGCDRCAVSPTNLADGRFRTPEESALCGRLPCTHTQLVWQSGEAAKITGITQRLTGEFDKDLNEN